MTFSWLVKHRRRIIGLTFVPAAAVTLVAAAFAATLGSFGSTTRHGRRKLAD